jgi:serine/threonine-protein kinase PpkA
MMLRTLADLFRTTACLLLVLLATQASAQDADVDCRAPEEFCIVTTTGLPLRLLTKPQSNIYTEMDVNSHQSEANLPAFEALFAFEMFDVKYDQANFTAEGWFVVGRNTRDILGYMRAEDVVMWKQALALAYVNPGVSERKPVLMFENQESLDIALEEIDSGAMAGDKLYEDIAAGTPPVGVISREPSAWVDINQQFYLLPILQFEDLSALSPSGDMRALQTAALTAQARSQQVDACDIRQSNSPDCFREQTGGGVGSIAADVVFVIDMTVSMDPYIKAVESAMREASQALSQKLADPSALKFGLVGYRDSPEHSPGIEWAANNFTSDLLPAAEFRDLLGSGVVQVATVGSGDHEEEVFAGVQMAIASNWSAQSARTIVLIGDASSHPLDHEKNTTGLSEQAVRALADQEQVYIASIYVGGAGSSDYPKAKPQFEAMAAGDGESNIAFAVIGGGETELEESLRNTIGKVIDFMSAGRFNSISSDSAGSDTTSAAILGAVRAAFVEYIGSNATPPSNITAWVVDRDLTDFEKRSFEIKVMVRKGELQGLMSTLNELLEAVKDNQTSTADFFGAVQTSSTSQALDITAQLRNQPTSQLMSVVPRWIQSLPYKSEILALTLDEFRQSSPADRTRFEERLHSLAKLYDDILNRPDAWASLNSEDTAEERVYMLDLANLP